MNDLLRAALSEERRAMQGLTLAFAMAGTCLGLVLFAAFFSFASLDWWLGETVIRDALVAAARSAFGFLLPGAL
jgi:hypothetical protein